MGATREVDDLWAKIWQGDKAHPTERASFIAELERMSKIAKKASCDMAAKFVQNCSQLCSTQKVIFVLKSLNHH